MHRYLQKVFYIAVVKAERHPVKFVSVCSEKLIENTNFLSSLVTCHYALAFFTSNRQSKNFLTKSV